MTAIQLIAAWGIVAIASAIAGGIIATAKRRDHSSWAAWSFIFPPLVIVVALLKKNEGPRPVRRSLDDEDRDREAI